MAIFTHPWGLDFETASDVPLHIDVAFDPLDSILQVILRNRGDSPARPRLVTLTSALDAPAASGWAWVHGRLMQRDAFVHPFDRPFPEGYEAAGITRTAETVSYRSHEQLAITLPVKATPVLFIGSLAMDRFQLDIEIQLDEEAIAVEEVSLSFDIDGVEIPPGESLFLQPVLLAEGRDAQSMIEDYAERVAAVAGARVPEKPPTGWCSWYIYGDKVNETNILANVEALGNARLPVDYIQVDDGFQSCTGDWLTPNERFPSGMDRLAARISEAGYRPGLWLAPFLLHQDSAALRENSGVVLKTSAGETLFVETWLGRCAVLDCTNPAAEAWLRHVISTVTATWGYSFLKLDALSYAAQPASAVRYHGPGTTASANLRRGLEIIREAAGESVFLLGCTCPFGPAVGLVDAMRVGPDVKPIWADGANPSVRHAMRMTLQRGWMHGRWWANDPDCLLVRDANTSLEEPEVRFLATAVALGGGIVSLSDDIPALPDSRRDLATVLLPPTGQAARAVHPGDGPVPSAWRVDLGDGRALLGVLNWGDTATWMVRDEVLAAGESAYDVWNARVPGMGDVLLRPHEGLLWQVTGPGRGPRLVGDSASLTARGLAVRQVSGQLELVNMLERSRRIAVEVRGQVVEVELAPGEKRRFQ
ncbi:MAG: glycoside hydrolase family 36 protein [Dehalococcoidia bacterium]